MRLSIIIPTLDEAATITATLAGLQPLRGQGHEVAPGAVGDRAERVPGAQRPHPRRPGDEVLHLRDGRGVVHRGGPVGQVPGPAREPCVHRSPSRPRR